jgi:hypothetical protein
LGQKKWDKFWRNFPGAKKIAPKILRQEILEGSWVGFWLVIRKPGISNWNLSAE